MEPALKSNLLLSMLYSIDIWSLTPQAWYPGLGTHCGLVWSELCTQILVSASDDNSVLVWGPAGLGGQRPDIDTVYQVIFHYYGSRLPK